MRRFVAPSVVLASLMLIVIQAQSQPAGDTPAADKAIRDAVESLRKARDTAPNAKDRDKIGKALAALEQLLQAKATQYTRDTFKQAVLGKSTDEVIAILGKPSRTRESGSTLTFRYDIAVMDSISGNLDKAVDVDFSAKTKKANNLLFFNR